MFNKITVEELSNSFNLIGKDWMLVTAGDKNSYNTMTASWGGFGILWHKDVAYVFIRPQRYTYEFVEKNDCLTLSFFDDSHREMLTYMGKNSGRDKDKFKEMNLNPYFFNDGTPAVKEANMIIKCRKLYKQQLNENCAIDESIKEFYNGDYHYMYVVEIEEILKR